ncbi:MAG: hypothetical protein RLZZ349_961, partial [Pseudomonadota bacterium]
TSSNFNSTSPKRNVDEEILRIVEELKQGSGFGSVEVLLHEGRVTQIEKREKLRFTQDISKSNPTVQAAAK